MGGLSEGRGGGGYDSVQNKIHDNACQNTS